jgi:hypothetical protein
MVRASNERSTGFYVGCAVWTVICVFLIKHDFGVIAFCGSIILAIWVFGLREKFSNEETASAYSVFNRDGKAIVGGLTATQFDRQMRGGGLRRNNNDASDDPIRGDVAVAVSASSRGTETQPASGDERLRRRKAAAAAAERRFQQHAETSTS